MALYLGKDLVSASSGSGGVTIKNQDKNITANGTYRADSGYTGLGVVKVDVQPKNQDKTFTENGTYAHDSGYTGLGEVVVAVPPTPPNNQDITVKENGTYTAEDGYSGLGTVTVEVESSGADANYTDLISGETTELIIPEGVTSIRQYALYRATNIKRLDIPKSVISMSTYAFYGCTNLEEIYFNAISMNDLQSYNNYVFYEGGKNSAGIKVVFGKDVVKLPAYLFKPYEGWAPNITSVEFEEGYKCTAISDGLFCNVTALESITLPDSVTSIGNSAFSGCTALAQISIPDGLLTIGRSVFYNCALTNIVIPESTVTIDQYAFNQCKSLKVVTFLGSSVILENYAFSSCSALEALDYTACTSVPVLKSGNAFANLPSTFQIRVPASLYDEWIAATNWSNYADYIVAV